MRHGKKINHLSRTASHRKALLANMACSLIEEKRINTTVAKAKALRQYVEPLLTKSKDDSTHSRRIVFGYLKNKNAVSELFRDVAPKIAERNGGYTRILKTGNRLGDNADMCFIELVDFNETYISDAKDKKTTRRSRRGGSKPAEGTAKAAPKAAAPKAEAADDVVEAVEVVESVVEEVKEDKPAAVEAKAETTEEVKEEAPAVEASAESAEEKKEEAKEEKKEEGSEDEEKKA